MTDRWEPVPVPKGDGRHDIGDETRAAIFHRLHDDFTLAAPWMTAEQRRQLAMLAAASVRALLHELGALADALTGQEGAAPSPQDLQRAIGNCYMAAKRGLAFGRQATPQTPERMIERRDEALTAIMRFCEAVGERSTLLRWQVPTEITDEPTADDMVGAEREGEQAQCAKCSAWCADNMIGLYRDRCTCACHLAAQEQD